MVEDFMKKQLLVLFIFVTSASYSLFAAELAQAVQQSLLLCSSDDKEPFDAHCEVVSLLNSTKKAFETGNTAEGCYQTVWSALHRVLNDDTSEFAKETKTVLVNNLKACIPERQLKDPIYRCFGIENLDDVTVQIVKQKFDDLSERAQNIEENQDFFAERIAFVNNALQENTLNNSEELMLLVRQARHQFLSPFGIAMYKACESDTAETKIQIIAQSFKSSCDELKITSDDCLKISTAFLYLKNPNFDFENYIPIAKTIIDTKLQINI